MNIHNTAIVDKKADIDASVEIGAYCVVEEGVVIKSDTKISPYAHIKGNTIIGENNLIHTGCVIGEKPQMLNLRKSIGKLRIGNNNIIREYVTINTSTKEDNETKIGNNNYFMSFSHIAHDCNLGSNIVLCNGSLLAGHVEINDNVLISGNAAVHQFVKIGRLAMVGGLSRVTKDVPPFMMLIGSSKIWGINSVGLKRASLSNDEIHTIKNAFNILYREGLPLKKSLKELSKIDSPLITEIIEFINNSKRGIAAANRSNLLEKIFLEYPLLVKHRIQTFKTIQKIENI